MKNKKSGIGLILLLLVLIAFFKVLEILVLGIFVMKDKNTIEYSLTLPLMEESLESITIEQDEVEETIENREDIKNIINILYGVERKTKNRSIQDFPLYVENLISVHLNFNRDICTIFVYKENNEYFIEEAYNGIYKISADEYDLIEKYIKNYKIEIIDESESCDTALEKFYESKLYEYYFSCKKSDCIYARINDGEKYFVKDLLNDNPTDYIISINKLKRAGLEFVEKEKYNKIEMNIKGNVYISRERIEDDSIWGIVWGTPVYGIAELSQEVFLIPKEKGKTTLAFEVFDVKTGKLVKTIRYEIDITDDLKVSYKEE